MEKSVNENDLAVFDSLLEGLANHAGNSDVTSRAFFTKTSQVIESIFEMSWVAIVAKGPSDSSVLVYGSQNARVGLAKFINSGTQSHSFDSFTECSEQSQNSGTLISTIKRTSRSNHVWGVVVVQLMSGKPMAVHQQVLDAIAETIEEHLQTRIQSQASDEEVYRDDLLRFSINAHSCLDQSQLGYHLANDARLVLACERVSVFTLNRGFPKLLAISSVASVEKRSALAKDITKLVRQATQLQEPIISDQPPTDGRQSSLLANHLETSGLPFLFGVPLVSTASKTSTPIGFLLAESTDDVDRVKFARGLGYVVPHATTSLLNAKQFRQIPFRRTLGAVGAMASFANVSRVLVGLLIGVLLVATLLLVPAEFKVRISGELRPVAERNVFAPMDGVVDKVFVNHGDRVNVEDRLVEIRSPELNLELDKAFSDIKKLEKLKEAKQIVLNQNSSGNSDPSLVAKLASEISDLDFQMANLEEQKRHLTLKREELKISSPISGQITTWQVRENLSNRPVRWGDPLLNIAKLDGDWQLIFRVPERRIGYILDRQDQLSSDEPLELEVFLESSPDKKFRVTVVSIDQSTVRNPELGPITFLKCAAPPELLAKRQGATVSGDVDCGKKSIWFVWTREMTDAIRRRFVW